MHIKKESISKRASRSQILYSRRSNTLPCFPNSLFGGRHSVKSIKSLNVYCLSEIFNYLEYKDLSSCRLVCTYWNECVQFHLKRRTHFSYGKALNNLPAGKKGPKNRKKVPLQNNIILNTNLLYACERCLVVNANRQQEKQLYERISPSPSPTCSEESRDTFSPSLSLTPISVSRTTSPTTANYCDFEFRCSDCQVMLKEFHQQLQQEMEAEEQGDDAVDEGEDFFSGFIDEINMNILEGLLSRMPKLTALKFAQGYRYGRLRQSCLEVSRVQLIERTFHFCPNLTRIDLSNCIGLVVSDFTQLVECYGKQLVSLNVSGTRIDENCLRVIVKGCDKLHYLNVSNNFCDLHGGCFEWLSDAIETVVADYNQNVRVLDGLLQGKGRDIIELELNIGFCINRCMPYNMIGNNFKNLISLKLTFKSFGKRKLRTMVGLAHLTELECLYLIEEIDDFNSESSLDDESVLAIMRSTGPRLRELYLHAASSLFGGPSSLTDASITHIDVLCPLLEVFSIKRASITDASLDSIGRLKNAYSVQLIDLENISKQGIARIMASFKQIESQELEAIKKTSGVDLNVNKDGPKLETLKRHCSLTPEMETIGSHGRLAWPTE